MPKEKKRPNIVWFISDDTHHKMLGCYGGNTLSPTIDAMARHGILFTNFYCASSACTPSRYNYMTGHYGSRCPADGFRPPNDEPCSIFFNTHLDPTREPSIGHAMQAAGYHTGFVGKWHVGGGTDDMAAMPKLEKGENPRDPNVNARMQEHQHWLRGMVRKNGFDYAASAVLGNHASIPTMAKQHNLEWTTQGALDFIDQAEKADKPFFLNMATTTIHGPDHAQSLMTDPHLTAGGFADSHLGCMPERKTVYERIRKANGIEFNSTTAGVLWMDDAFGAVMQRIREQGAEDNTLFIYSTDHGFSGGKFSVYESGGRIPFLMQWMGQLPQGVQVDAMCQNVDLLPTLLDLIGAQASDGMVIDGKSMVPLLDDPPTNPAIREELYSEFGYTRAIRRGHWKYIAWRLPDSILGPIQRGEVDTLCTHFGRPIPHDREKPTLMTPLVLNMPHYFEPDQLYDLDNDPCEQHNLAADPGHAETLRDMRGRLRAHLDKLGIPFPLEDINPFYHSEPFARLVEKTRDALRKGETEYRKTTEFGGFDEITRRFYSG